MNPNDPNLPLLESVARDLGELLERFVFVGGCATGLLVTDVAAAPVRATQDVDVIAEVLTLTDYYALERELEGAGFSHDRSPDAPVCRWIVGNCLLDVMPTDEGILGFGNRWFSEAIRTAESVYSPSGRPIRLPHAGFVSRDEARSLPGEGWPGFHGKSRSGGYRDRG